MFFHVQHVCSCTWAWSFWSKMQDLVALSLSAGSVVQEHWTLLAEINVGVYIHIPFQLCEVKQFLLFLDSLSVSFYSTYHLNIFFLFLFIFTVSDCKLWQIYSNLDVISIAAPLLTYYNWKYISNTDLSHSIIKFAFLLWCHSGDGIKLLYASKL